MLKCPNCNSTRIKTIIHGNKKIQTCLKCYFYNSVVIRK